MSRFSEREENRKKGVAASMILDESQEEKTKGRPKENREIKQRISMSIYPSIYENIKKIAYIERRSISELISECLSIYIEKNQEKVDEYNKLK